MKTSTRYILVAVFVIFFALAAPALILYVSGRKVDLEGGESSATGILDAKSNPTGAELQIDGKDHSSTPAIARFLAQGEYNFTLHKDGYYDWSKRLPIEGGKVTYAQDGVTEVQLLKKSDPKTLIPKGVSSFALIGNTIWFVQDNNIISASVDNPSSQNSISLNFHPNSITVLRDNRHIYLSHNTILDTTDKTIAKIPRPDSVQEAKPYEISITPDNVLLYLDGSSNLYAFNPQTKKNWLVKESLLNFTTLGNTGYFVEYDRNQDPQTHITTGYWNGTTFKDLQTLIAGGQGPLYITNNKELFSLDNLELERVGQKFEPLASNVVLTYLDPQTNELSFLSSGNQLQFYNFLVNRPQLLTRSDMTSQTVFMIRSSIGYGFIGNDQGLEAIEIDSRDHQNRYQLIKDKQVWQIAMTDNQKTILALVDGSIVAVDIRN